MKRDEYVVTCAVHVPVASNHQDAAVRALAHITRAHTPRLSLRVTGYDGVTYEIDLTGEAEPRRVDAIVDVPGDHIIGRPLVHVVPSDKEPAAVFAHQEQAERYAAAAGEGWEDEHGIVADRETGEALIAEAQARRA